MFYLILISFFLVTPFLVSKSRFSCFWKYQKINKNSYNYVQETIVLSDFYVLRNMFFYRQEVFFMFKNSKAHVQSISSLQYEKLLKTFQKCAFEFWNIKKLKKTYFFACSKLENASKTCFWFLKHEKPLKKHVFYFVNLKMLQKCALYFSNINKTLKKRVFYFFNVRMLQKRVFSLCNIENAWKRVFVFFKDKKKTF